MGTWTAVEAESGARYLTCEPLREAGLLHAFTLGRASRGLPGGRAPAAPDDGAAALAAAGLAGSPLLRPRQVHGASVAVEAPGQDRLAPLEADAVVIDRAGVAAAVATADCVGAIIAAPRGRAFAVLHAGWRGVLAGVVFSAVDRLASASGVAPGEMILAAGPAASRCCYEVGSDVAGPFAMLFHEPLERDRVFGRRGGKDTVDPAAAVEILAVRAGLLPASVHSSGLCTICRADLCPSYRREGAAAGRMLAAAMIAP